MKVTKIVRVRKASKTDFANEEKDVKISSSSEVFEEIQKSEEKAEPKPQEASKPKEKAETKPQETPKPEEKEEP